jgi:hypothetical protein
LCIQSAGDSPDASGIPGDEEVDIWRPTSVTSAHAQQKNPDERRPLALSPKITTMDDVELQTNATENFDADRPWQN